MLITALHQQQDMVSMINILVQLHKQKNLHVQNPSYFQHVLNCSLNQVTIKQRSGFIPITSICGFTIPQGHSLNLLLLKFLFLFSKQFIKSRKTSPRKWVAVTGSKTYLPPLRGSCPNREGLEGLQISKQNHFIELQLLITFLRSNNKFINPVISILPGNREKKAGTK